MEPVGAPPPFDAELAPLAVGLDGTDPYGDDAIPGLRSASVSLSDADIAAFGFRTEVVRAAGVPLLICRPVSPSRPVGVLYAVHGGAMITGDFRGRDLPLHLRPAAALGLITVSVDYRLAPEHPHPAPVQDCYAGLAWTAAHLAGSLPLVVAGGSAGGALAAAVTLLARERGGPRVDGQMLLSPLLDDRQDTVSARQLTGRWDHRIGELAWRSLLDGLTDIPASAAPARAVSLAGLPPSYVDVGSAESFRDEAVDYAHRLWAAGNDAELHVWPGAFHGFDTRAPDAALSLRARAQRIAWLRRLLG